jgi:dienelactone hydrolase
MDPLLFPKDPSFWYETQRALGHTAYGGADIGEVITTSEAITPGDHDGWHNEWLATADRVAVEAHQMLAAGHKISARDGLMRASNYYRVAEFFLPGDQDDPRIDHAYGRGRDCFLTAAGLFSPPIEAVEIPYEDTVLHGYFYRAAGPGSHSAPRPTMIMHSGFDGPCEELHYYGAAAGQERGYHVLTFDGPGQPAARHLDGLVFRPDWENVVTPVLDWLLTRPEVDPGRIGLLGLSMGGLLAPRAAAFEHRLAACVAVDGIYDLGLTVADAFRGGLDGGIAEQITCPTLVCDGEEDIFYHGQPQQLFDHLNCPKALFTFATSEGSGAHCHAGAQRIAFARIYDWLDDTVATPAR